MKCKNCNKQVIAKGLCVNHYYLVPEQRMKRSKRASKLQETTKLEVLAHYSNECIPQCCWDGCTVIDIDMLTLDHLNDDGGKHLSKSGRKLTGLPLYRWAKANGFPKLFQTLCGGHQLKKAIEKKREERLSKY